MGDTIARAVMFAFICLVLVLASMLVRALWRAFKRFRLDSFARSAGAFTSAAQDRAAGITKAFRDGRGR